jgi:folate-binding protein YgfZ
LTGAYATKVMPVSDRRHDAFFDLSGRVKLRLTGGDRLRFLNGQVTNNVAKATESEAIAACVLNAKGRVNAHVFISATSTALLLDSDVELREALKMRLERYIIADDVEVEDVTDQFALFHVLATSPDAIPEGCRSISINRFGSLGRDLVVDSSQHDEVLDQLSSTFSFCDGPCSERFRIERGIPRWGRELTEEIIPVEANLGTSCVDYDKGCYIGQEVISRMKMSGQLNKKLCGLRASADVRLAPGARLFAISKPATGKEVGWITSATQIESSGRDIGLGYVKRGFNTLDTELEVRTDEAAVSSVARVKVVELPFTFEPAS